MMLLPNQYISQFHTVPYYANAFGLTYVPESQYILTGPRILTNYCFEFMQIV
jgi:hypothetical protein